MTDTIGIQINYRGVERDQASFVIFSRRSPIGFEELKEIENIDGVESASRTRYSVEIVRAEMFTLDEIEPKVLEVLCQD